MNNAYKQALIKKHGEPLKKTQLPDGFEWEYMRDVYAVVTRSWIGVRVGDVQFRCGAEGDEIQRQLDRLNVLPQQVELMVNLYDTLEGQTKTR